jgi:hypothetical protein
LGLPKAPLENGQDRGGAGGERFYLRLDGGRDKGQHRFGGWLSAALDDPVHLLTSTLRIFSKGGISMRQIQCFYVHP